MNENPQKIAVLYVERKPDANAVSIEKVFRQVAESLSKKRFAVDFQSLEYGNSALGTLKNLLFFKKRTADIYHVTGHVHYIALLLPTNRTVLTVHDAVILHIRSGLRRFILKKLFFDLPIRRLKYITAVSEATKIEIIAYTNCPAEKIRVIENPLQTHFYAAAPNKFNRECPTILQVGTTANKNLERLIGAVAGIRCRLIIVGEINVETSVLLEKNRIDYVNKLGLSDSEIASEYAEADLVAFCSTFEGFGLPIIEAQAMLTPVVTSNISPLKEVAGDGAALADPFNSSSIKNCILEIINNEDFRQKIIAAGAKNVERYRADKISAFYESLYAEIAAVPQQR